MFGRGLVSVFLAAFVVYSSAAYNATVHKLDSGEAIEDHYIVVIKQGYDVETIKKLILTDNAGVFIGSSIKFTYTTALNGFSARLPPKAVEKLRSLEAVKYIDQDRVVKVQGVASWGLDRISQQYLPLDGRRGGSGSDGSGVNVYVIDTGIYPESLYFDQRPEAAFDSVGDGGPYGIDCQGHGTHCSGTVASNIYGVAPGAKVYGIRVLGCDGSGTTSGVVAGCDFVARSASQPAVVSMSLGSLADRVTDDAVRGIIQSNVSVVVAAGNSDAKACLLSPARVSEAITVGATDWNDARAVFSNYGKCVDIFAPGVDIPSAGINGQEVAKIYSGTSMACPHVTGAVAVALSKDPSLTPAEVKSQILRQATSGVVTDPGKGSPNLLLFQP